MICSSYLLGAGLLSTLAAAAPAPIVRPRQSNQTIAVTFKDIQPSLLIDWKNCYAKGFQCTYLTVPLDYADLSVGTTDVAFIRYLVSEDAEDLLYNPGGPGGSGVESLLGFGERFAKQWPGYNPVSFDPRGVKNTQPSLACSYGSGNATLRRRNSDTLGDMRAVWDKALKENTACTKANQNTDAKYVGTSAVVQDMVHFTEVSAAMKGKDPSKALINYYGVSYGTLVGQTLVAMYPDRLRRVLLDGNVYGVAHYQGWEPSGIDDLAHGIWLYSQLCYQAGPKWCPLAQDTKSGEEVQERIDLVVATLKANPIKHGELTIDDTTYLGQVQQMLYGPRNEESGFATISKLTIDTANGTASLMQRVKRDEPTNTADPALGIITAVDIAGRYPWSTYEQWKAAAESLAITAPYGAKGYAGSNGIIGLALNIIPPKSQFFPGFKPVKPSANVLFVNTVADPVTPMSSARQMSKLFAGSGVLIVDGPGHGYSSAPSRCASKIIADYFTSGVVPASETWCKTSVKAEYYFGAEEDVLVSE